MAAELDRIDRRILQHLQQDARMSNADLAKAVHVSAATCYRRTQRLFQEGYIHTVRAEIVPARVSRGTLVVVGVVLDRSTPESFATLGRHPQAAGGARLLPGRWRLRSFLKIRVRDIADFNKLHGDQLIALPGVRQTRTFFVMKEVVDNGPLHF
jgi:Lrp/AsnC family transcriptional regulator, leucine-responsive regulatory protein